MILKSLRNLEIKFSGVVESNVLAMILINDFIDSDLN